MKQDVRIPQIGDVHDIPVVEINVQVGDVVAADTPVLMLESDKATMDIPSPAAGRVNAIHVSVGDKVSEGTLILTLETQDAAPPSPFSVPTAMPSAAQSAAPWGAQPDADLLVLGGGPGGYTAAFRAADLGLSVILVERGETLGGVCLNVGCIPSKALLHVAKVIGEAADMAAHGVAFGAPRIDLDGIRAWKNGVVGRLTSGLAGLARRRKVEVVRGIGRFVAPHQLSVEDGEGERIISFRQAVIAAGSEPARLPFLPDDPRIMDSTGALALADVPERLLVLGGGIIGLEMAQVYAALGSRITIAELMDQLIPGAERDLVAPLAKRAASRYERVLLKTRVSAVETRPDGLGVRFEGPAGAEMATFDKVLVAVGRTPNGKRIGADAADVRVDGSGFIPVDRQMRTNQPHIFAIGDVVGQPMLAHKATHQGKVAAEAAAGHKAAFDTTLIPSVAYTDPEVAWVGLTEAMATAQGLDVGKGVFPWAASGRALSLGRPEGFTRLLFERETGRVVGAGMVGPNAGELIAEATLAIEMGAVAEDLALTIHPHPTLSETLGFAAEAFAGTLTDL